MIKVGTRVLTRRDGRPALSRLFSIVEAAADLVARGRQVIVVSSGRTSTVRATSAPFTGST